MYPNQPYVSGMFSQIIDRMQGQVPAIQQYLAQNPGLSDLQYYQAAQQANISPLAIAMATQSDPYQIYNRFQTAEQQYNAMQPGMLTGGQTNLGRGIGNATQQYVEDKFIEAGLAMTPLAPIAPFVGPIRTGIRLFGF